jgi:AbrB family looped-hinge helix DNA binding protein
MKATGIVRRIDDLGRVVIPKEIRRTLRIREGDPLEIFTEKDGEVIFKKYSPMGELQSFATQICESMARNMGHIAVICDRDCVIAHLQIQLLYGCHGNRSRDHVSSRDFDFYDTVYGSFIYFNYFSFKLISCA